MFDCRSIGNTRTREKRSPETKSHARLQAGGACISRSSFPGRGRPLQPKSAGLPGITRQRVGLPLKIFRLNSILLLLPPPSPALPRTVLTACGRSRDRPLCAPDSSSCFMQSLHGLLLRWYSQKTGPCIPCTGTSAAGARRCFPRRILYTCSGCAGARRPKLLSSSLSSSKPSTPSPACSASASVYRPSPLALFIEPAVVSVLGLPLWVGLI